LLLFYSKPFHSELLKQLLVYPRPNGFIRAGDDLFGGPTFSLPLASIFWLFKAILFCKIAGFPAHYFYCKTTPLFYND
jgi:hypothetical protein